MVPGRSEHAVRREHQGGSDAGEGFKVCLKDIPFWCAPAMLIPRATTDFKRVRVTWFKTSMHAQPGYSFFRVAVFTFRDLNDAMLAWSVMAKWIWVHAISGVLSPSHFAEDQRYNSRLSWYEPSDAVYFQGPFEGTWC